MPAPKIPHDVFFLDRACPRSLQAQLREAVVSAILSGQAAAGARMPSSRKLASHLNVARMTVTLAYQELVAQGYLEAQARSSYRVAQVDGPITRDPAPHDGAETPDGKDRGAAPQGASDGASQTGRADWQRILSSQLSTRRKVRKPADWRDLPYPFVYGQMDERLFDHAAWRDCSRQALGQRDFSDMAGDFAAADDPLLVDYIRARSLPRRGITARADEILVTVGAQNGLWLTTELLTRRPLRAICENPGYPDTLQALRWCGADASTVDIDDDGLPPSAIPDGTQAVFVTPSHHAPTGVTMSGARRAQLLARAAEQDFIIVEDDYEFEMSFLEPPSPALKSLDRADRVIYVGSFSKAMFPGLRLGYLVGPPEFIAEARELRAMILRHPPGHQQRTAAYFLAQGHYDRMIHTMRLEYARRRQVLQSALDRAGLQVAGAAHFGGSSLWVQAPVDVDAARLEADLLAHGVLIEPGAPFFDAPDGPRNYFRLGYSSITADRIEAGVQIIAARVAALSAKR